MYARKFSQDFHHAPVIFERVQTRPRQHVAACERFAILRLVHVPEYGEINAAQRCGPSVCIDASENSWRDSRQSTASAPHSLNMLEWPRANMRLLDKYIGREVASHSILGLAVFTFVFFVPQLVRLMDLVVRHSGGVGAVALLFLCSLAPVLAFTIPMAVLVGVLIGLGRLSADSEIVAIHASGISMRRLLVPIGFVAASCAVLTLALTFWLIPLSWRTLAKLEQKLLSSQAPFAVQPRVFDERFPHFVLYVQDVEAAATRWRGVFLASSSQATATSNLTLAQDAQVVAGTERHEIELHLGPGSTHDYDPHEPDHYSVTTFGQSDIPIDVSTTASATKSVAFTDAEKSISGLLSDNGPNW